MPISIEQLRAARGLLGWSQGDSPPGRACRCLRSNDSKADFGPRVSEDAREKLQLAIEAAGVEFIDENGGGSGVRFRRRRGGEPRR